MIVGAPTGPMPIVVGVDPGDSTGLCALRLGEGRRLQDRVIDADVFLGEWAVRKGGAPLHVLEAQSQVELAERLMSLAGKWEASSHHEGLVLAIESFRLRERSMDESLLSPVRQTSGLLALLEASELKFSVVFNSPSDAKNIITDDVLRSHALYTPGKRHAMDAARQALLALRKAS